MGRSVEAVLFDMDGVLMNTNPFHRRAWRRFCRETGRQISEKDLREKVFGWRTEEGIENLWGRGLSWREIGKLAARKEEIYRQIVRGKVRPVRGLLSFLEWLERGGHKMALATSACRENVELILTELGVGGYFPVRVLASEVGRGKPDPSVFLAAAGQLGFPPQDCLVIEDSLSGVAAARAAGMVCAALATTHQAWELERAGADMVCRNFTSKRLKKLVEGNCR